MRIIFSGSSDYSAKHLEKLISFKNECLVVGVLTGFDKPVGRGKKVIFNPVKKIAKINNISLLQLVDIKNRKVEEWIKEKKADCLIVVSSGILFSQSILDIFPLGCFNFHASLLPRWRGPSPIQHSILFGDKETGITVIKMNSGIDTGDIFYKILVPISFFDTTKSLSKKLLEKSLIALHTVVDFLISGKNIKLEIQDNKFATYSKKLRKIDGLIDWNLSAAIIDRCIKAFNPWPSSYFFSSGKLVKIWKCLIIDKICSSINPGVVLDLDEDGIYVSTGYKVLKILKIQLMNRRKVLVKDFLKFKKKIFFLNKRIDHILN